MAGQFYLVNLHSFLRGLHFSPPTKIYFSGTTIVRRQYGFVEARWGGRGRKFPWLWGRCM